MRDSMIMPNEVSAGDTLRRDYASSRRDLDQLGTLFSEDVAHHRIRLLVAHGVESLPERLVIGVRFAPTSSRSRPVASNGQMLFAERGDDMTPSERPLTTGWSDVSPKRGRFCARRDFFEIQLLLGRVDPS